MSPIPTQTNKDIGKKEANGGGVRDTSADDDSTTHENDQVMHAETTVEAAGTLYTPLAQTEANSEQVEIDDDDDDDDEESSDDEVEELDEDVHFEMLASSRAFTSAQSSATSNKSPHDQPRVEYSFETDFFERKSCLESEEIVVDEAKSKQISQLMSGFKLPESSIPDWAKHVPENVWKQNLLSSIEAKKTDLFSTPPTTNTSE